MKWTTAVRTLEDVADRCAHVGRQPEGIIRLRVFQAWVFGPLLGPRTDDVDDVDGVRVALVTNAREEDCAFGTRPPAAGQWLAASSLETKPVRLFFRSGQAPVWNHVVERPVRFWTREDGVDPEVLARIRAGEGSGLRPAAPTATELAGRLDAELAVSLAALRRTAVEYDEKRWSPGSPTKRADALADASLGYLSVRDARDSLSA
ncbi:DUF7711 family protein [Kineococcus rhizosphaerae]|uniref:DUF7711 domain-containing protein n=1 Tax=Kineococcus rhizosphaerae TaxID=559628 RepID=A0A2T0R0V5_9ACTN|nr:hypothetical protein [Kineococcus rhizosphaerae]PRY12918.1 hypothetical protein CLV37_109103 [Kineococcus rhizosphaerae]